MMMLTADCPSHIMAQLSRLTSLLPPSSNLYHSPCWKRSRSSSLHTPLIIHTRPCTPSHANSQTLGLHQPLAPLLVPQLHVLHTTHRTPRSTYLTKHPTLCSKTIPGQQLIIIITMMQGIGQANLACCSPRQTHTFLSSQVLLTRSVTGMYVRENRPARPALRCRVP